MHRTTSKIVLATIVLSALSVPAVVASPALAATHAGKLASSYAAYSPLQRAPAAVTANLIANGDFSAALTPSWRIITHNAVSQVSVTDGMLRMTPTGWVDQIIPTMVGQAYTFTGWIRINAQYEVSANAGVVVLVNQATPGGNPGVGIVNSEIFSVASAPIGQWKKIEFGFTAPTTRTILTYRVLADVATVNAQFNVDADNFVLSTTGDPSPEPTGPAPISCGSPVNLLKNGDFSDPTFNPWQQFSDLPGGVTTTASIVNGVVSVDPNAWIAQDITTTTGTRYYVSAWTKVDAVYAAPANSGLIYLVTTGDTFSQLSSSAFINTVTSGYQRTYFTFVAVGTATKLHFRTLGGANLKATGDDFVVSACPIPSVAASGTRVLLPIVMRAAP